MLPIFQTCAPRNELLFGELREEIFAARLRNVIEVSTEEIYQNRQRLINRVRVDTAAPHPSAEERIALLRAAQIDAEVHQIPSFRREEWY